MMLKTALTYYQNDGDEPVTPRIAARLYSNEQVLPEPVSSTQSGAPDSWRPNPSISFTKEFIFNR